jgi:uncharacterized membrane protein YkvA (DUF1232 family)
MDEQRIRRNFWPKIRKVAAKLPFAEDCVAAFYCATDAQTPTRAKAVLLGALAYFILPVDIIPDFVPLLGFTDDAAVIATALATITDNLKPKHREAARRWLDRLADGTAVPGKGA